jgi:hypothetical protein
MGPDSRPKIAPIFIVISGKWASRANPTLQQMPTASFTVLSLEDDRHRSEIFRAGQG